MSYTTPASKLEVGDVIVVDGVPVDIIKVDVWMYTVKAYLSDDPDDCCRFPRDAIVLVVARFEPFIHV